MSDITINVIPVTMEMMTSSEFPEASLKAAA